MRARGFRARWLSAVLLCAAALPADANVRRTLCVFDVIGANGDVFAAMQDYRAAATAWGVIFELKPYTSEAVAKEDFQAGECDAVGLTGIRTRGLVRFAGSLDMMGALPEYRHQRTAIRTLLRPAASDYLRSGPYEVAGIAPAGAVYLFVNDQAVRRVGAEVRRHPTVEDLAGMRIATLDYDRQAVAMVRFVGASVVGADISRFAGMFNNGSVDICYAPAYAYRALELYKGLGENGAVIDYPLARMSAQLTIRHKRFPDGFAQQSRDYFRAHIDRIREVLHRQAARIPERYWVHIPERDQRRYQAMFREVRQRLRRDGDVYDPRMMTLLRRIRCHYQPGDAECSRHGGG